MRKLIESEQIPRVYTSLCTWKELSGNAVSMSSQCCPRPSKWDLMLFLTSVQTELARGSRPESGGGGEPQAHLRGTPCDRLGSHKAWPPRPRGPALSSTDSSHRPSESRKNSFQNRHTALGTVGSLPGPGHPQAPPSCSAAGMQVGMQVEGAPGADRCRLRGLREPRCVPNTLSGPRGLPLPEFSFSEGGSG